MFSFSCSKVFNLNYIRQFIDIVEIYGNGCYLKLYSPSGFNTTIFLDRSPFYLQFIDPRIKSSIFFYDLVCKGKLVETGKFYYFSFCDFCQKIKSKYREEYALFSCLVSENCTSTKVSVNITRNPLINEILVLFMLYESGDFYTLKKELNRIFQNQRYFGNSFCVSSNKTTLVTIVREPNQLIFKGYIPKNHKKCFNISFGRYVVYSSQGLFVILGKDKIIHVKSRYVLDNRGFFWDERKLLENFLVYILLSNIQELISDKTRLLYLDKYLSARISDMLKNDFLSKLENPTYLLILFKYCNTSLCRKIIGKILEDIGYFLSRPLPIYPSWFLYYFYSQNYDKDKFYRVLFAVYNLSNQEIEKNRKLRQELAIFCSLVDLFGLCGYNIVNIDELYKNSIVENCFGSFCFLLYKNLVEIVVLNETHPDLPLYHKKVSPTKLDMYFSSALFTLVVITALLLLLTTNFIF